MRTRLPLLPDCVAVRALLLTSILVSSVAEAGAPGWVDDAIAAAPSCGVKAGEGDPVLVLFVERATSVDGNGNIRTRKRTVTRIAKPEALPAFAIETVGSNDRVKVLDLRGWRVDARGSVHKTKQREGIEMADDAGAGMYSDFKTNAIYVPDPKVGDVIAFESEWESHDDALEDKWPIESNVPVCLTRYVLTVPSGWTPHPTWVHTAGIEPQRNGKTLVWEAHNVAAVPVEPSMPPWLSLAGWMRVRFDGGSGAVAARSKVIESWDALGRWYAGAAAPSLADSSAVRLEAEKRWAADVEATPIARIAALAAFAQKDIRYVAVELGAGSYVPRRASDVLANRYGDCKDKATLLMAMLRTRGIEARYVVIHSVRGATAPEVPTLAAFNHVILAIRLEGDASAVLLPASVEHERLGRILYFDPTDERTPFGRLPPELEGGLGLLVGSDGSELVTLPVSPPESNAIRRTVRAVVLESGAISGDVREERSGAPAREMRSLLQRLSESDRHSIAKKPIAAAVPGAVTSDFSVENLRDISRPLVLQYRFNATRFVALGGKVVTLRRSLFEDASLADSLFAKPRTHSIEMTWIGRVENEVEIVLPDGFRVSEAPEPVTLESAVAKYESRTEVSGTTLRTIHVSTFREREIRPADVAATRSFFRKVRESERAQAVLLKDESPSRSP